MQILGNNSLLKKKAHTARDQVTTMESNLISLSVFKTRNSTNNKLQLTNSSLLSPAMDSKVALLTQAIQTV